MSADTPLLPASDGWLAVGKDGSFSYTALTRFEASFFDGGIWLQVVDDDAFRRIDLANSGCGALEFALSAPT